MLNINSFRKIKPENCKDNWASGTGENNNEIQREETKPLMLEALEKNGAMSRRQIAEAVGASLPWVHKAVIDWISQGVVVEAYKAIDESSSRPNVFYQLAAN